MDNYGCRLFVWISKIRITENFSDTDGKRSPHANSEHFDDVVYDHGGFGGLGVCHYEQSEICRLSQFFAPGTRTSDKILPAKNSLYWLSAFVGWFVYTWAIPGAASPVELRIQHPTLPQDFEKLENPFRQADAETQRKGIEEGKILFQTYCRPCHGSKADGNGPFANSFRLRPINFQDPGTIATVVDNYLFWRIKEGGPGLPSESTPWDSAMPSWKDDLKDDEVWKIIMGEYDTAGVMPRQREKLE